MARRYSIEERARVIQAIKNNSRTGDVEDGNLHGVERDFKKIGKEIARSSIRSIRDKYLSDEEHQKEIDEFLEKGAMDINDEFAEPVYALAMKIMETFAKKLERLERDDQLDKVTLTQLSTSFGTMLDKLLLLKNRPTSLKQTTHKFDEDSLKKVVAFTHGLQEQARKNQEEMQLLKDAVEGSIVEEHYESDTVRLLSGGAPREESKETSANKSF